MNKVCKWTQGESHGDYENSLWYTDCDEIFYLGDDSFSEDFNFCIYCGRKLVPVEYKDTGEMNNHHTEEVRLSKNINKKYRKIRKHFNESAENFYKVFENHICGDLYKLENTEYFFGKKKVAIDVEIYERYSEPRYSSSDYRFIERLRFTIPIKFFLRKYDKETIITYLDKKNITQREISAFHLRKACKSRVARWALEEQDRLAASGVPYEVYSDIDYIKRPKMQILERYRDDLDKLKELLHLPISVWNW